MLPTDKDTPWPPATCASTLTVVSEADEFLAAGGVDAEFTTWEVRRGGWWRGSRPYLGEQRWLPSRWLHNRRRAKARLNTEILAVTVPVARELVSFSASQVVGNGPSLYVEDPGVQGRLDEIGYETEMVSTLTHAAEWAAAYGGVYFRVVGTRPYPQITVVRPDLAVPSWSHGRLVEVIFETKLPPPEMDSRRHRADNQMWWRLLERYYVDEMSGGGVMECGLYASGDRDTIGVMQSLDSHSDVAVVTQDMDRRGLLGVEVLPMDHIPVYYVPNMRSRFTSGPQDEGRSDLSGMIDLLRVVDQVASSVAEEVQVGKPKIVVPEHFIKTADGKRIFAEGDNVFTPIMADPAVMSESNLIKQVEFTFNYEARIKYIEYFRRLAVQAAGWSPQDFGYDMQGYAESGTALRERKIKSLNTQARKRQHFGPPVERAARDMLLFDGVDAGSADVRVEFPAAVSPTDIEMAEIMERYARSGAVSRYEMIRYLRPEWSESQIEEELSRPPGGYGAPEEKGEGDATDNNARGTGGDMSSRDGGRMGVDERSG